MQAELFLQVARNEREIKRLEQWKETEYAERKKRLAEMKKDLERAIRQEESYMTTINEKREEIHRMKQRIAGKVQ